MNSIKKNNLFYSHNNISFLCGLIMKKVLAKVPVGIGCTIGKSFCATKPLGVSFIIRGWRYLGLLFCGLPSIGIQCNSASLLILSFFFYHPHTTYGDVCFQLSLMFHTEATGQSLPWTHLDNTVCIII